MRKRRNMEGDPIICTMSITCHGHHIGCPHAELHTEIESCQEHICSQLRLSRKCECVTKEKLESLMGA